MELDSVAKKTYESNVESVRVLFDCTVKGTNVQIIKKPCEKVRINISRRGLYRDTTRTYLVSTGQNHSQDVDTNFSSPSELEKYMQKRINWIRQQPRGQAPRLTGGLTASYLGTSILGSVPIHWRSQVSDPDSRGLVDDSP